MLEILRRGWRAHARNLIEAERARPHPPFQVGEQLRRDLRERLARDLASGDVGFPVPPWPEVAVAERGQRSQGPWRLVPKAAAALVASMVAYAPLALAGLGATAVLATGGYLVGHPGALTSGVHRMRQRATHAIESLTRAAPAPQPVDLSAPAPVLTEPPPPAPDTAPPPPMSESALPTLVPAPSAAPPLASQRPSAALSAGKARTHPTAAMPTPNGAKTHPGGGAGILESRLLEQARAALRIGQNTAALKSLAEAERIPDAALAEEREALTIMALLRSGSVPEARRRMSAFSARYPQSFHLTRLQTEVGYHEDEAR